MHLADLHSLARPLARHGVVRAEVLRLAGAHPDTIKSALKDGWSADLPGIYVIDRLDRDDLVKAQLAVEFAGEGAAVTGLLACRWYGLRWVPDSDTVQVLVEPERRRRGSTGFVLVRRCNALPSLTLGDYEGIAVAPLAQAVIDGTREAKTLRDVRGLVLGAVADRRCTTEELLAVLDRGGRAKTRWARRACVDAQRGAASPPEAELVDGLLATGVPFYCNVEVLVEGESLGIADVWLVGTGVGGEIDSRERHEASDLLDGTLLRDKRFLRAGAWLEHITPTRYRSNPAAFHHDLFAQARERQAKGLGDPRGLELRPRGPLLQGKPPLHPPYELPRS